MSPWCPASGAPAAEKWRMCKVTATAGIVTMQYTTQVTSVTCQYS